MPLEPGHYFHACGKCSCRTEPDDSSRLEIQGIRPLSSPCPELLASLSKMPPRTPASSLVTGVPSTQVFCPGKKAASTPACRLAPTRSFHNSLPRTGNDGGWPRVPPTPSHREHGSGTRCLISAGTEPETSVWPRGVARGPSRTPLGAEPDPARQTRRPQALAGRRGAPPGQSSPGSPELETRHLRC